MKKELAVLDAEIQLARKKHSEIVNQAQIRFSSIVATLLTRKILIIKTQLLSCTFCKKTSQVRLWGFIQTHLHIPPRGYIEKERCVLRGTRVCILVCPKCSHRNSIYVHPQREKIVGLVNSCGASPKEIFGRTWDQYGDALFEKEFLPD